MEELIVPGIILAVLAVFVVIGLRLSRNFKPWEAWEAVAAEWDFVFDKGDDGARHMSINGVTEDGIAVKIAIETMGALEAKQHITNIWLTLPTEIPLELKIGKAVNGLKALRRAKEKNPHDPALPLIWKIEGLDEGGKSRIEKDEACRQRLTNLYMVYPHTKIADGELHIAQMGIMDKHLSNTVKLSIYLTRDLARASK